MVSIIPVNQKEKIEQYLLLFEHCFQNFRSRVLNIHSYSEKLFKYANTVVLCNKDDIIGIIVYYSNDSTTKVGYITLIAVLPGYRRNGFGNLLLNYCLSNMKNNGMTRVRLEVDSSNEKAKRMYERNGFVFEKSASCNSEYYIRIL